MQCVIKFYVDVQNIFLNTFLNIVLNIKFHNAFPVKNVFSWEILITFRNLPKIKKYYKLKRHFCFDLK